MKFSEDILKEFNLEPQADREPVNVMKVRDMLSFMKTCAERIFQKSNLFTESIDADIQMDCIDIVAAKLNDFTQVFRDTVIFIRKEENTYRGGSSLRYCMMSYDTFEFQQTEKEKCFLKELLLRNEITHDYFNRDIHQQKLIWIMQNCGEGALDVYYNIYLYCEKNDFLDKYTSK